MHQPLTVAQVAARAEIKLNRCSEGLRELRGRKFVVCLNEGSGCGRVYWLTRSGGVVQQVLHQDHRSSPPQHFVPVVDWDLYGKVCTSHRRSVIATLSEPMQPSAIKRRAAFKDPTIRMSANNVRDVVKFLLANGIVELVRMRRKAHPLYQLTAQGKIYQQLLVRAKERAW